MLILSPEQIRNAENKANEAGLSFFDMMENAGHGCAEFILKKFENQTDFIIFCGKGKNGGDGYVIARKLFNAGKNVTVIKVFSDESDGLSKKMKNLLPEGVICLDFSSNKISVMSALKSADVYIDAIFGIGFRGNLPEEVKELYKFCRNSIPTVAIDIPSGLSLNANNFTEVRKADYTLSMMCLKKEHVYKPQCDLCGEVSVIPIGFVPDKSDNTESLTRSEIKALLPERNFSGNKASFGKPLIIAGSKNMTGAAVFAAKGAVSCGAGLLSLAFPECCRNILQNKLDECVFIPLAGTEDGYISGDAYYSVEKIFSHHEVIAVGCGLGMSDSVREFIFHLIKNYKGTLIIDADGINAVSQNIDILKKAAGTVALTPHPLEMSRLTGIDVNTINASRENTAKKFACDYNVSVLLKGANTVIASPDGRVFVNRTGSTALSRGGSGDLLTGIITALACQGTEITNALIAGAYIHGLTGDIAEEKYTAYASTIERIIRCIPEAFSQILKG